MDLQQAALTACGAIVAYVWYKLYHALTISDVPGPKNPSWIYGHAWWWMYEEARAAEKSLLEEYGNVARWNGFLGEERLWIADPKAIHHILQGSSSRLYEKPYVIRERLPAIVDRGLVWAAGDVHKRQRRVMTPAFGLVESRALHPYFAKCSNFLVDKWHDITSNGESAIIDVNSWLSKATLDAIGAGALNYDFGALESTDNKLTESYVNLSFISFGRPSRGRLFMMDAFKWAPEGFFAWMVDRDQSPAMARLRENKEYAHEVAAKLIEEKRQDLKDGGVSRRDALSLLVKANSALRPNLRLNNEEIVAQVRTIMFAGHETVASTLTFALWELAKCRHVQERLRAEILETLGRIKTRGDSDFTVNDFDSMPYLLAVGKEVLRVYPALLEVQRMPNKDDVLPLSKPIVGISGKVYKELSIPAGTLISISTVGYNLNKDLWGPDAYEFRPERWLEMDGKPESPVGVYGNLATFSAGNRSCIGWRFATIEMHTFLVTLVRQFDFSLPDDGRKVKFIKRGMAKPVVVGEEDKGPQMPLKITVLGNE